MQMALDQKINSACNTLLLFHFEVAHLKQGEMESGTKNSKRENRFIHGEN